MSIYTPRKFAKPTRAKKKKLTQELATLRADLQRAEAEKARLQAAVQSRHDYGPASRGEQEDAWIAYCQRSGWNPQEHPSAKNAYVEGFCDGDSYSEGDESRAVLRTDNARLTRELAEARAGKHCITCVSVLTSNKELETKLATAEAALKAAEERRVEAVAAACKAWNRNEEMVEQLAKAQDVLKVSKKVFSDIREEGEKQGGFLWTRTVCVYAINDIDETLAALRSSSDSRSLQSPTVEGK